MENYLDEIKRYDDIYKISKEYKKDPIESIYYPTWIKIVDMISNSE